MNENKIALDDLLMAVHEIRSETIALLKNERWSLIHRMPKDQVNGLVDTVDQGFEWAKDTVLTADALVDIGLDTLENTKHDVANFAMLCDDILKKVEPYTVKLTHRARFRKSFIRN